MKIIYNDSQDAKIASVILYQKFVMNFGLDMKEGDFFIANDYISMSHIHFEKGEYIIIIGLSLDQYLYNEIERLLMHQHCKVLYISNTYSDIIDNLYSLYETMSDGGLSLKIVHDSNNSLSLLSWIASRYRLDEDISNILLYNSYNVAGLYEYLIFEDNPNNKISIPWLIRFISDFICYEKPIIAETPDFHYGIETMMDIPSNHINWERLLIDDKEVMQLMTSGIPIRQYVERKDIELLKYKWRLSDDGIVINDIQIDFKTLIKHFPSKKFYVKMISGSSRYEYYIYFNKDCANDFMNTTLKRYFNIDLTKDLDNGKVSISGNIVTIYTNHNVLLSNTVKLNWVQRFIKKLFRI